MKLINFESVVNLANSQANNIKNFSRGTPSSILNEALENVIKIYALNERIDNNDLATLFEIHAQCFDELHLEKNKRLSKEEVDTFVKRYLENLKKLLTESNLLLPEVGTATQSIIKPTIDIHDPASAKLYYASFVKLNPKISEVDRLRLLSGRISPWLDVELLGLRKLEVISHHKNGNLLVNSLYSAVDVMNYEQTMQTLIDYNFKNSVSPYLCGILKAKIQKDADFAAQFHADARYAPILAQNNIKVGEEFPLIKSKPRDYAFEFEAVRQALEIEETTLSDMQHDIINVGVFLLDNQRVQQQLNKLEKILEARAKNLNLLDQDGKSLNPGANKKFLSGYFKEWLAENGFAYTKLDKDLDTPAFLSMLNQLTLFKDKQLGQQYHGEWTHLIQWWCLIEANRDNPFFKNTPQELYRWLGTQKGDYWLYSFEIPNVNSQFKVTGFRAVTALSDHLTSPEFAKTCPLLQQLVSQRVQKREAAAKNTLKPSASRE